MSSLAETDEVRATFGNAYGETPFDVWSAEAPWQNQIAGATKGLYRVQARGRRLILKVIGTGQRGHEAWRVSTDEDHPYYWKREALVYASGITNAFGISVRAPAHFGIFERSAEEVAVWLEDVRGAPATIWPIERYGIAARHLGRMQGRYIAGEPLPSEPWWSRGWLREYLERHVPETCDRSTASTAIARAMPAELFLATQRLWDEREWFLTMLDSLPRTLCHLDMWTLNLFDGGDKTVVIDWAYAGIGAIGEDIANLVPDTFLYGVMSPDWFEEMQRTVVRNYLCGLRDAGGATEGDHLRLAFAAAAAIKYVWMVPHLYLSAEHPDADPHLTARVVTQRIRVMRRLFALADEARTLARAHGV